MADAAEEKPAHQPTRMEKQYQRLLDDYLGPATGLIILVICLFGYRFSLHDSEQIADALAMNPAEQELIIPPLAALLEKQHFDAGTRDAILQSGDWIGLCLGISAYSSRVLGTLRDLRRGLHEYDRGHAAGQAAPAANGAAPWAGNELAGLSQYAA